MNDRERIAQIIYYGAVLLVGYLSFLIFQPFLVPLGWGAVLAVCVYPLHTRLTPRVGRSQAALLSTLLVLVLIVVPIWLLVQVLVERSGAGGHDPAVGGVVATDSRRNGSCARGTGCKPMCRASRPSGCLDRSQRRRSGSAAASRGTSGKLIGGVALIDRRPVHRAVRPVLLPSRCAGHRADDARVPAVRRQPARSHPAADRRPDLRQRDRRSRRSGRPGVPRWTRVLAARSQGSRSCGAR